MPAWEVLPCLEVLLRGKTATRRSKMEWHSLLKNTFLLAALLVVGGCTDSRSGGGAATPPAVLVSGPRAVVEEYLKAASTADGAGMYALIATSERKDETPQSLKDT